MNILALVLYLIGLAIVIGSHVWLLIKGSLPKNKVTEHSLANLLAAALIIIGYILNTRQQQQK